MIFNTFQFLIFFIVVWTLYYSVPARAGLWVLCLASYYFYMCSGWYYVFLILYCVVVNYFAAFVIERSPSQRVRKATLVTAIAMSLATLFFYKYLDFTIETINDISQLASSWFKPIQDANQTADDSGKLQLWKLILPVGISFFTFQTLSYTIDVYRGHLRPERDFLRFATFVAFFPQLVAGPIERATNLLPQIGPKHPIRFKNFQVALPLILWGLFKKVVVADNLSIFVDKVYQQPLDYSGPIHCIAIAVFSVQIYCDFAGYSDMAIGLAKLFGIDLMVNFRQPFTSRSISELWTRWHISLMSWFRDYVYIPLGGSKVSPKRWIFNVMMVYVLSSMWHGARWTFLIWGLLNASYFLIQRFLMPYPYALINRLKIHRIPLLLPFVEWAGTFVAFSFAAIFFRSQSISDAFGISSRLLDATGFQPAQIFRLGLSRVELAMASFWFLGLLGMDYLIDRRPKWVQAVWNNHLGRIALYQVLVFIIIFFGRFEGVQFIYFQF